MITSYQYSIDCIEHPRAPFSGFTVFEKIYKKADSVRFLHSSLFQWQQQRAQLQQRQNTKVSSFDALHVSLFVS